MCILFVCSDSCFYTFGRIDWVGWRLARGDDQQSILVFIAGADPGFFAGGGVNDGHVQRGLGV